MNEKCAWRSSDSRKRSKPIKEDSHSSRALSIPPSLFSAGEPAKRFESVGIVSAWLASQANALTRQTYALSIKSFFDSIPWATRPTDDEAAKPFFGLSRGAANYLGASWIAARTAAGIRSNTVAKDAAALCSLVKFAGRMGFVDWELSLKPPTREVYRDVAGPGLEWWQKIFKGALAEIAEAKNDRAAALAVRNAAILRLLFDQGLRVGEVVSLDLENFAGEKLLVIQKRKVERAPLALAPKPIRAVEAWLGFRGRWPGPLFTQLDNRRGARQGRLGRLSSQGIQRMVARAAERAGYPRHLTPHAIRHAAGSEVAELARGNILEVRDFLRHKNVATSMIYVDRIKNQYGRMARRLGDQDGTEE